MFAASVKRGLANSGLRSNDQGTGDLEEGKQEIKVKDEKSWEKKVQFGSNLVTNTTSDEESLQLTLKFTSGVKEDVPASKVSRGAMLRNNMRSVSKTLSSLGGGGYWSEMEVFKVFCYCDRPLELIQLNPVEHNPM